VIDTGVLISALISRRGTTAAVLSALRNGRFTAIYSTDLMIEIIEVLMRPIFKNKYHIQPEDITALINLIRLRGELVNPQHEIVLCRDSKDNKFLEAAFEAKADCIISGDADLLDMIFFENFPVLTQAQFLETIKPSHIRFEQNCA